MTKRSTKILIASLTLACLTTPAFAGKSGDNTRFEAVIKVVKNQPVEANYASLQKQVMSACKDQIKKREELTGRARYIRSCKIELMDSVISKTGDRQLAVLHNSETNPAERALYAGTKR